MDFGKSSQSVFVKIQGASNEGSDLMTLAMRDGEQQVITEDTILAWYENIRPWLPRLPLCLHSTQTVGSLEALADQYDVFVFDAYGVLNVGESAIVGAVEAVEHLQAQGKQVLVLTNGASLSINQALAKFHRLGFKFTAEQIISSRDAAIIGLRRYDAVQRWGFILPEHADATGLPPNGLWPDDPDFLAADGFIFLNAAPWDDAKQQAWVASLSAHPRPIVLANPDLVAPFEDRFRVQPGYYCMKQLPKALHPWVEPFGKPFQNTFDLVKYAVQRAGLYDMPRVLMLGDTLHTDILGGLVAGFDTALVADFGARRGMDLAECYAKTGIVPHWSLPHL